MQIEMRYFAILRERAGRERELFDVPPGSSASQAFELRFPGLGLPVGYARNGAMCSGAAVLAEGDELALLPPIGGG